MQVMVSNRQAPASAKHAAPFQASQPGLVSLKYVDTRLAMDVNMWVMI